MGLIDASGLVKTYRSGEMDVPAVKGVDFTIEAKSFVSFVGPSGSGKSTLLNMIGCLDHRPAESSRCSAQTSVRWTGVPRRTSAGSTSVSSSRTST